MTTAHSRPSLLTLPNAISCSRLAFAAGFLAARNDGTRLGLIGIAAASDFLDGWLARRQGASSRFGALIDPIADRAFALAAVGGFLLHGELTGRQCLILLSRDFATALGYLVARVVPGLRGALFEARTSGKLVTVLQLMALATVVVAPHALPVLIVVVGVASAISVADYTWALWRVRA